jgi:hypothetical protein
MSLRILLLALSAAPPACAAAEGKKTPLSPGNTSLVLGKAGKVVRTRFGCESATFTIERVYVGTTLRKGQTFRVDIQRSGPTTSGLFIQDKFFLKDGERGVWWVRSDPATKKAVAGFPNWQIPTGIQLAYFGPARDVPRDDTFDPARYPFGHCNPLKKGLAWAEKDEKLFKADAKGQVAILKQYARDTDSLYAYRALDLLYHCMNKKERLKYLKALAEEKGLSIGAELGIDSALSWDAAGKRRWFSSPVRLKFLRRWVTEDLGDGDARVFLERTIEHRLDQRWGSEPLKHLDYLTVLGLAQAGLANDKRSEYFKDCLLQVAAECRPKDRGASKAAFDYLIREMAWGATPSTRLASARLLSALRPLSADQAALVRGLLRWTEGTEAGQHLEAALSPLAPR